jgi:transcriptional regulator with XRE-family HTH domain
MEYVFGNKLRNIREKKGLTMKNVAESIKVTESLISQIETNKISPSIDTLMKIVDFLEIDIDYIFADFKKPRSVQLIRPHQRKKISMPGIVYEQLSHTTGGNGGHELEAYYIEISPSGRKGSREYGHSGQELGIILEGQGDFEYGTRTYPLATGDSVSFASDLPHVLKNTGKQVLKSLWVITPPKMYFKEM